MQEVQFPEHLAFLLTESARYKVLWGGRGAGKTENIAIALIILACQQRLRIACFREFQKSIDESVYEILKAKIYAMGLEDEFKILDKTIVSKRTGSQFIFLGLRYNINSIKSLAFIDIAWVEEANVVSKMSWDKLNPTIRGRSEEEENLGPFKRGPEIWVSFNPELDTDNTYERFVLKPPNELDHSGNKYAIIKKVNWSDNKWFPADLREEMEQLKEKDPTSWLNVWEGHCKQTLDGAIYAEEIRKATLENRITKVKYDPNRPVHTFWDLGHSDKTAIWFVQTIGVEFNCIDYYENSLKKMPFYIHELQQRGYNYGRHNLPHDGAAETVSNITPEKQLRALNWNVRIVDAPRKKFLGINAARTVFDLCNFDAEKTERGLQCLRRYTYKVNEQTGNFSAEPDHDTPWSHGADAFQTFALSLKSETAASKLPIKKIEKVINFNRQNTGWMGSI